MVVAVESESRRASLRRLPFVPEPTSVTTLATDSPWGLPTRWSWPPGGLGRRVVLGRHPETTVRPLSVAVLGGTATRILSDSGWANGTGSWPSRNHAGRSG